MILKCVTTELKNALAIVKKALPQKKLMPILNGIKLKATKTSLLLSATDLELTIDTKIEADVEEIGEIVVDGKTLCNFISKITDDVVKIRTTSDKGESAKCFFEYGENVGYIQYLTADEYPNKKDSPEKNTFYISQTAFRDILNNVICCASEETSRPVLNSCLLKLLSNDLTAVACDGYRLGLNKKEVEYDDEVASIVVPLKSAKEILSTLDFDEDKIKVCFENNYLSIMLDKKETQITTRLINEKYLQYQNLIPQNFSEIYEIDRQKLIASLERMNIIYGTVKLVFKNKKAIISTENEISKLEENIEINTLSATSNDLTIFLNNNYLLDSLKSLSGDTVLFNINSPTTPIVMQPTDDIAILHLILPVRRI